MIYTRNEITDDIYEKADACIIGSGAGGAVMAKELSEAGLEVVLLEEGGYFKNSDFTGDPVEMTKLLYRSSGSVMSIGIPPIMIPLGRCIGGTTVINSGTCFRTPDGVLKHWQREFGLESITNEELTPFFERVENIVNAIPTTEELLGGSGLRVKKGAEALGYRGSPLLRNVRDCRGCGICVFGCPTNAKQAMHVTYIPAASKNGARIYANCRAERLISENGRAAGIEGSFLDADEKAFRKITVKSKITILSCGAIFTPAFLLKNRIGRKNNHLGRHLHLHPATRVMAMFDEPIMGWKGVPQSFYIDEFERLGIMLEGFFVPPSIAAVTLPFAGMRHKEIMSRYSRIAGFGVMVSDTTEGRVRMDRKGNPLITYWLNKEDTEKAVKGIALLSEVFLAAGAKEIYTGLVDIPVITSQKEIGNLYKMEIKPSHLELMAFHPMGTLRMGADPKVSVIDEHCELREVKNLFVADASIFPSSLGVNPQISIMAFSTYLADYLIKTRVKYFC